MVNFAMSGLLSLSGTKAANDLKVNVEDGASCCGAPTVLVSGLAIAGA